MLDETEAQSAPVDLRFKNFASSKEWIKHVLEFGWLYPNSTIADLDENVRLGWCLCCSQTYPTAFAAVLDGVCD